MTLVSFIGVASGWGAQQRETEKGPEALEKSKILSTLPSEWIWKETLFPTKNAQEINLPPGPLTLPFIENLCNRISLSVDQSLSNNHFPVVIGGDHTSAIGTWSGVVHHFQAKQKFGLIWIDAHMDAHIMETSPSKAYHGMPLAALLGFGEPSLTDVLEKGPILSPEHVCLIGVRSYEEGEAALLKRLGIRIYFMKDVQTRGFKAIFQEALNYVKHKTKGFGISIDLDAFDPQDAPGVGSPEPNGLRAQEVLPVLSKVQNDSSLKALEIVEYNPLLDKGRKTLNLMRDLLLNTLPQDKGAA